MKYYKKSIFGKFPFKYKNIAKNEIPYSIYEEKLQEIISSYPAVENKAARMQLNKIILPAIATYQIIMSLNNDYNKCYNAIEKYVLHYYKPQAFVVKACGKLPFFYNIFKSFFPLAMKMYPTEYWNIEWLKCDNDEISFNMNDCLYFKVFKEYNCENLTAIFCAVDNLCYDHMSKKVSFIRTQTFGRKGDLCDFRFVHRK